MSIISINRLVDLFKDWSVNKAPMINDFCYGPLSDWGNSRQLRYPCMWMDHNPSNNIAVLNRTQIPEFTFDILFVDKINLQENVEDENGNLSDNRRHIMSDMMQLCQDFINDVMVVYNQVGITILGNVIPTPVEDETTDKVCGWRMTVTFKLLHYNCTTPSIVIPTLCQPARLVNSDGSFELDATSGVQTTLPDIQVTINGGQVLNKPSNINLDFNNYYFVSAPTGTRIPRTTPISNPATQTAWLQTSAGITTGIGSVTKTSGSTAYNAGSRFYIPTNFAFEVEFNMLGSGNCGAGIRFLDKPQYDFGSNDLVIFKSGSVYMNGVYTGTTIGAVSNSDVIKIKVSGLQYQILKNNVVAYNFNNSFSDPLARGYVIFTSALQAVNDSLTNIKLTYL